MYHEEHIMNEAYRTLVNLVFYLQTININNIMLRIAVQAKGRLFDETMSFLEESDIKLSATKRTLLVQSSNFPLEVLFLRDDDIPQTVATGVADLGIVGENVWDSANAVCHWPCLRILNIRGRSGLRVRRLPLRIPAFFPGISKNRE